MSFDNLPERGRESRNELWIAVGVLSLVLGLFAAEVATNYHPGKLVGLLFVVAWVPLIALHELGHAAAAWLVGWRVGHVVVGFGRTVWRARIGTAVLELRMYPVMGFATSVPMDLRLPRVKDAFVYFGGPGVELLLAGALVWAVGTETFFAASGDPAVIAAQAVGIAALAGAVFNLIPTTVPIGGRLVPNDGMGILTSFFRKTESYRDSVALRYDPDLERWTDPDDADWWRRR